eukprot:14291477-Alexandrium_andersonii.AAC.1
MSGPWLASGVHALVSPTSLFGHLLCSTWSSCCHACSPLTSVDSIGSVCSSSRSASRLGGELAHIVMECFSGKPGGGVLPYGMR